MPGASLGELLSPRHIAVVGATDSSRMSAGVLRTIRRHGYAGPLHPVNPNRPVVDGLTSYPTLDAVPGELDLVLISVRAEAVPEQVAAARRRGARLAVVLSSDFAEAGRLDRLESLREAAGEGIRILGPGSFGFVNLHDGIAASWSGALQMPALASGGLALVSESGGLGGCLFERAQEQGIGLSYVVWTGTGADLGVAEVILGLLEIPAVSGVGVLLERALRRAELERIGALARERGVPVCVTKAGRRRESEGALRSHAGALGGSYEGLRAVCRAQGIAVVDDALELLPIASVASAQRGMRAQARRVFAMSGSGGTNVMLADALAEHGWELAAPSPALAARIQEKVPRRARPANPLDLTGGYEDAVADEVRAAVAASGEYDMLVEAMTMVIGERAAARAARIVAGVRGERAPLMILWPAGAMAGEGQRSLAGAGLYPFASPPALARAAEALREMSRRPRDPGSSEAIPAPLPPAPAGQAEDAEAILRRCGIPFPKSRPAVTADEAAAVAVELGWPVVLKAVGLEHKSEAGGVAVDVRGEAELRRHWEKVASVSRGPVQVQRHVAADIEIYLAGRVDPDYGPLLLVGIGGVAVEVERDLVHLPCPASEQDVLEVLPLLRRAALLDAFRGRPAIPLGALAALAARVSALTVAWAPGIRVLELNPVALRRDGTVMALDALVEPAMAPQATGPGERS